VHFSLGRPIFVLAIIALITGVAVWRRPPAPRADLAVWSFDETQVRAISPLLDEFRVQTGWSASISLMGQMGENLRLASAFMADGERPASPDLCEIEIHSIGQFLRPPIDEIGLLPLDNYLKSSGWDKRIVASRFAPWSKTDPQTGQRIIFGVPEDVHPVTISYRKDLFDEAGVDLQNTPTWTDFQQKCLAFQAYWSNHGHPDRRAIALSTTASDELVGMLLQRHVNLIDASNGLHFTDSKVLDTVVFYAQMAAGPRAISGQISPGVAWTEDFASGNVCAVFTPDWEADFIHRFTPELTGKVQMIPLPRFDRDDAPTTTWGGTMVGICRSCPHPDMAWKLLEFLYLSPQSHRARLDAGDRVLPAIPRYWSDPEYREGVGGLYLQLADQIPERIMTPYTYQAELALAAVLQRAVDYVTDHGDGPGLESACTTWLREAQDDIARRIEFGNYQP
jgi:arabinosaccharide transport system substrate-binding protein